MSIYTDEIFGPVLSVVRVDSYDDAVMLINDNPYGNGTALFTNDGGAARRFQDEVEVGMIGINVPVPVPRRGRRRRGGGLEFADPTGLIGG
jgi:malonate-semialdehyde dehydrogenase (acetylating)/methylmalonate-semialdehyde dehydrogenase